MFTTIYKVIILNTDRVTNSKNTFYSMFFINRIIIVLLLLVCNLASARKPHIVVIIADDLGWNDVSFHGSNEIPTPNIDALAYNGVILNSHYTQSICTPSRAAFLTGKYPIHTGMQHGVISKSEPRGLNLEEKLLPERLREHGYSTYAIGKWHLGFYKKKYTPTFRGFDYHYGFWQGLHDYYTHMCYDKAIKAIGYDLRRNMNVDWDDARKYSTELFTSEAEDLIGKHNTSNPMFMYLAHIAPHAANPDDPLQAPDEDIAKFGHIDDPNRRVYAAMVSQLDKSVGRVIVALRKKEMLENSIILFMSDNGAPTVSRVYTNFGSNFPLRGLKESLWEGGSRCVAAIWSPLISKPHRVSNHLMHLTDWLPTFYSIAGLNTSELENIDGLNMWNSISNGAPSPRTELIYNIDEIDNCSAIRKYDWKYISGTVTQNIYNSWYGSSNAEKNYFMDQNAVLTSEAGTVFAENFPRINDETIATLRKLATIECVTFQNLSDDAKCDPLEAPCLFNIRDDPCEMNNRAKDNPKVLQQLEELLLETKKTVVKATNVALDHKADPKNWNNTWSPWQDTLENQQSSWLTLSIIIASLAFIIIITIMVLFCCKMKVSRTNAEMYPDTLDRITKESANPIRYA